MCGSIQCLGFTCWFDVIGQVHCAMQSVHTIFAPGFLSLISLILKMYFPSFE